MGSYRNTQSPYGLFDMLGNVTEYTDTAGTEAEAGRVQVFGGSWATPPAEMSMWSALAPPVFRGPTNPTGQIGFRVVTVQAVPEPSSAALTAVAIACLAGLRHAGTAAAGKDEAAGSRGRVGFDGGHGSGAW